MPWISLAATRYRFQQTVRANLADPDHEDLKGKAIDAADGRDALLAGDPQAIAMEIRRATGLLAKSLKDAQAPHEAVMAQIMGLAVIASLGDFDPAPVFAAIAKSKRYKNKWQKSLQLIAARISGLEANPSGPYEQHGHVPKDDAWYRLVSSAPTELASKLATTPDHPRWPFLASYVLPLAHLVVHQANPPDVSKLLRTVTYCGDPDSKGRGEILYERKSAQPTLDTAADAARRETWRGFDAIEAKCEDLYVYYYLGMHWQAPLVFQENLNTYDFLDDVDLDWRQVQETVAGEHWEKLLAARKNGKCIYVVVYDSYHCEAPQPALQRAAEHYGLRIEARDILDA